MHLYNSHTIMVFSVPNECRLMPLKSTQSDPHLSPVSINFNLCNLIHLHSDKTPHHHGH